MSLGKQKTAEMLHELCELDARRKNNHKVCDRPKNI